LVLNRVVLWTTVYLDAAVRQCPDAVIVLGIELAAGQYYSHLRPHDPELAADARRKRATWTDIAASPEQAELQYSHTSPLRKREPYDLD
jgi:hypothetical protein